MATKNEPSETPPAPAEASGEWKDIVPLTADDVRNFRNQKKAGTGEYRWNPSVSLKHLDSSLDNKEG